MLLPVLKSRATRGRTSWGFDLLEGLRADRCAICTLTMRSVNRFFDNLSYENTNDPDTRERFVAGGGFCRDHAWHYADHWRDGLSVALLYRHLLVQARRDGQLRVGHACIACRQREQAEDDLAAIFHDELQRRDFRKAAQGAMLCLRHARQVLAAVGGGADRQLVLACAERGCSQAHAAIAGVASLGGALAASAPSPVTVDRRGPACPVCEAMRADQDETADWSSLCTPHVWDRLAKGQQPLAAVDALAKPARRDCPDCHRALGLAAGDSSGRRCLNHTRSAGEPWRQATAWLAPLLGRLERYVAKQDYQRLGAPEGDERGAHWEALYWTVGATRKTVIEDLFPRLGLSPTADA